MDTTGRTLHLIDIENQLGHGRIKAYEVAEFMTSYKAVSNMRESDQVIIAVSSRDGLLELARANMTTCRFMHRPGKNGADLELLDVMLLENIADRFDRVVLASGDGGFVPAVFDLGIQGVHVTVIGQAGHISKRLRLVAHQTIEFPTYHLERYAA